MVRSRARAFLAPAAVVLLAGLPVAAHVPSSASAAQPSRPALDVPHSLLHSASVPVIVQMNSAAPAAYYRTPELQSLLAGARTNLLTVLRLERARNVYAYHLIPAVSATVAGQSLRTLLAQPGVQRITLDQQHALAPSPVAGGAPPPPVVPPAKPGGRTTINVGQTVEPESYTLTGANQVNAEGFTGAGVRVAVIDSGIDLTQPDLTGTIARDASGAPLRVDFTGTGLADTVGHGTASASMIVAQGRVVYTADTTSDSSGARIYQPGITQTPIYRSHFRVRGMAPGVRIMSAKIFDARSPNGGGYDSWIIRAIEWAVDHHANVISESFGGLAVPSNGTDPTAVADEAAVAAGVTVVAADGNEGPGQTTISSPANAPGVIGVGASTQYRQFGQTGFLAPYGRTTADNIASFTSRGPTTDGRARPDLVAPGAFSWALFPLHKSSDGPTTPPFDVGTFGGTSQATPVTAGAAALVIDAYGKMHGGARPSPALVRQILTSSAHDLGYPASDQGAGRVNALKAVQTVLHSGPSFLLSPTSLSIAGTPGTRFSKTFKINNSGSTTQTYHVNAALSLLTGIHTWTGVTNGTTALHVYHFTVRPGLERIVGAVYWDASARYNVNGSTKEVALRVALYDPLGRFVNYTYGAGSGVASAQAAHPMPGVWSLVVSDNGRKVGTAPRRYSSGVAFTARLGRYVSLPFGTLSRAAVTLLPGQSAPVTLSGTMPRAGTGMTTIHVIGDHTAAIPVVLTSLIPLASGGLFEGNLSGGATAYFSLSNENKAYAFNVPKGTRTVSVALSWPNPGYGVILLLLDPSGEIVDGQFNGTGGNGAGGVFNYDAHSLEAIWSNPAPGRWTIVVTDATFSGKQGGEPFRGRVTLNDYTVTPLSVERSVLPGGTFDVALTVHNTNKTNVVEGYVGYATSDTYSELPLGTTRATLTASGKSRGVYDYKTGFVPPGTKELTTVFAATRPAIPVDLTLADPIGFGRALGRPVAVTVNGHAYQGVAATVTGSELPIGRWNGEVTLRQPSEAGLSAQLVGESFAYALTPLPWVTFDHGLRTNGFISGGQLTAVAPNGSNQLNASVTVPLNAAPGTYRAHLFVYSVFGDQVASVPLTINVQPHAGQERL